MVDSTLSSLQNRNENHVKICYESTAKYQIWWRRASVHGKLKKSWWESSSSSQLRYLISEADHATFFFRKIENFLHFVSTSSMILSCANRPWHFFQSVQTFETKNSHTKFLDGIIYCLSPLLPMNLWGEKSFSSFKWKREFDELMMVIIIRSSLTSSAVNAWKMKKKKTEGQSWFVDARESFGVWSWNTRRIWNFSLLCRCRDWSSHSAWVVDVFYNVKSPSPNPFAPCHCSFLIPPHHA